MITTKIITVIVIISFLSPFYSSFDDHIATSSCSLDQSTLSIFEPLTFPENESFFYAHGGGLNKCGCHFNRKTNECHCHRNTGCGCECQPSSCN